MVKNTPDKLEISYQKEEFLSVYRKHSVIVVQGETGCGKTTQIPQFIHEYYTEKYNRNRGSDINSSFNSRSDINGSFNSRSDINGRSDCNITPAKFLIGITQPRRLAVTAISKRLNEEITQNTHDPYDLPVGYKIMYETTFTDSNSIKIMTEGVLLREMNSDILLSRYDAIILDEIHERSVNIDMIIFFLSRIIHKRKKEGRELKVVLMSATLNIEEIERIFDNYKVRDIKDRGDTIKDRGDTIKEDRGDTIKECKGIIDKDRGDTINEGKDIIDKDIINNDIPDNDVLGVFTVKSKTHKVSVFYEEEEPYDMNEAILSKIRRIIIKERYAKEDAKRLKSTVDENITENSTRNSNDDKSILVFLAGKSDIYLIKSKLDNLFPDIPTIPLHSGLSKLDQDKIFSEGTKIVLSTNIAETSLTVPGIYYVIDSGIIKSRYATKNTVEYKEESISKYNAIQRKGRAGRVGPGVCYRMYTGWQYDSFKEEITPAVEKEAIEDVLYGYYSFGIKKTSVIEAALGMHRLELADAIQGLLEDQMIKYESTNKDTYRDRDTYRDSYRDRIDGVMGDEVDDDCFVVCNPMIYRYPLSPFLGKSYLSALDAGHPRNVMNMITVTICSLQLGYEIIPACVEDCPYPSDFIAFLFIYKQYIETVNQVEWCSLRRISHTSMEAIRKLASHISNYQSTSVRYNRGLKDNSQGAVGDILYDLDESSIQLFNRIIIGFFSKHIAVRHGEGFLWKGEKLLKSNKSVETEKEKFVIFEKIKIKNDKKIMDNIGVVEEKMMQLKKK